jgi:hypothetical protein
VRLNENALFHPEGELQRACDRCFTHFRQWEHMRSSRQNSESSGSGTSAVQVNTPIAAQRPEVQRVGSIANSYGVYNWSTF